MMQLIHSILAFAVVATALPSLAQNSDQPQLIGSDGALMASGQCNIGQYYCFSQIVDDLSMCLLFLFHQN
jgi:hypothetical protein